MNVKNINGFHFLNFFKNKSKEKLMNGSRYVYITEKNVTYLCQHHMDYYSNFNKTYGTVLDKESSKPDQIYFNILKLNKYPLPEKFVQNMLKDKFNNAIKKFLLSKGIKYEILNQLF